MSRLCKHASSSSGNGNVSSNSSNVSKIGSSVSSSSSGESRKRQGCKEQYVQKDSIIADVLCGSERGGYLHVMESAALAGVHCPAHVQQQ